MNKLSISNPDMLKVKDPNSNRVYFGCNQAWYPTLWQRLSGCGPSTVTNICLYQQPGLPAPYNKPFSIELMKEIWHYVTPTRKGVNTTKLLYEGLLNYASERGLPVAYEVLNIPAEVGDRPSIDDVIAFISSGLTIDSPIAFLNLDNGDEMRLDKWHWVTIVELEHNDNTGATDVVIFDEGKRKTIDFALWFVTTKLGGGLVYFKFDS